MEITKITTQVMQPKIAKTMQPFVHSAKIMNSTTPIPTKVQPSSSINSDILIESARCALRSIATLGENFFSIDLFVTFGEKSVSQLRAENIDAV